MISRPMDEIISRIVDRIVTVASPTRILLFGSRAPGDSGPDSDLDLLDVVYPND